MGFYSSVRHEILLIAGKGSCCPTDHKLANSIDSVQVIEKTNKHSQKPEGFRKLIESLYPDKKKIELFAREKIQGWQTWGNEI
jgi:N6-adenosine-specific RNA methylase IME4